MPDQTIAGINIESIGEKSDYLKMLIWGLPGVGKTRLAGSAYEVEAMRPILYIDVEGGTESIKHYPEMQKVRVKDKFDNSGRLVKSAFKQLEELYEELKKGKGGYTTVIIDNLSEAYQLAMRDTMAQRIIERPDLDPDIPGLREYGKTGSVVRRWVRHLRDLDMNVILTAHENEKTDDNGRVLGYVPSLPGKLPNEISGFMDMVLYLYTKEERTGGEPIVYRKLLSQPMNKRIAKDRTDSLPTVLDDPTMQRIYDARNGKEDK